MHKYALCIGVSINQFGASLDGCETKICTCMSDFTDHVTEPDECSCGAGDRCFNPHCRRQWCVTCYLTFADIIPDESIKDEGNDNSIEANGTTFPADREKSTKL
jgi:hypothetical protein